MYDLSLFGEFCGEDFAAGKILLRVSPPSCFAKFNNGSFPFFFFLATPNFCLNLLHPLTTEAPGGGEGEGSGRPIEGGRTLYGEQFCLHTL